jgi:hypothetical protein
MLVLIGGRSGGLPPPLLLFLLLLLLLLLLDSSLGFLGSLDRFEVVDLPASLPKNPSKPLGTLGLLSFLLPDSFSDVK